MVNGVHQHSCFITQGCYIGYMFRLLIGHRQACSRVGLKIFDYTR